MAEWRLVELRLRAEGPCPMAGWSGSAAYRILVETTRREAEPKNKIYAHPIYLGGRPLLTGVDGRAAVLEPGARLAIRAAMSEQDAYYLLAAVSKNPRPEAPCHLEAEQLSLTALEPALPDGHGFATVKLVFAPTAFMFHGRDVLYPSPQRIAYSLTKTYRDMFGTDLKQLADRAPTALELTHFAVRPVRVGIGEARTVPAYIGKAELAIYGNVETWLALLKLGQATGVGISRAIGFGKYKIKEIKKLA
ncbi:CRISPR system precrRNA processing endoribonuclease RAMP protein Cas6 [Pyrobaculum sp.]|uniref:CRISPR system precrRNA processing endoribonuclease RAMP protein Cas6 n=1 Tax=Pyrobaculum sp. TaxID=2004705 RepID=UPI003D0DBE34